MKRSVLLACVIVTLFRTQASEAIAEGEDISIEIISPFTYRIFYTTSTGIANDGTSVGDYVPNSGQLSFARSREGFFTKPISFPGADRTYARSVNTSGVICGFFNYPGSYPSGFFYDRETYTQYNVPNAPYTIILGENDEGDFVGAYANPTITPFLNHKGNLITFPVPGADFSEAMALNNRSQIVGFYYSDGGSHGFSRETDGTLVFPLDYPGATDTFLTAINDRGTIVGTWHDATNITHGLVLELPATFTSFDYPDSTNTSFGGINNKGFISGSYTDRDGYSHGFIARATR